MFSIWKYKLDLDLFIFKSFTEMDYELWKYLSSVNNKYFFTVYVAAIVCGGIVRVSSKICGSLAEKSPIKTMLVLSKSSWPNSADWSEKLKLSWLVVSTNITSGLTVSNVAADWEAVETRWVDVSEKFQLLQKVKKKLYCHCEICLEFVYLWLDKIWWQEVFCHCIIAQQCFSHQKVILDKPWDLPKNLPEVILYFSPQERKCELQSEEDNFS